MRETGRYVKEGRVAWRWQSASIPVIEVTESNLDGLLRELADLQQKPRELPDDVFAERPAVGERPGAFHVQADGLRDAARSIEELEVDLGPLHSWCGP